VFDQNSIKLIAFNQNPTKLIGLKI